MAETLVTQYAGTVDNDNLPKLGELRFSITPAQNTNVRYNLLELSTKAGEGDVVVSVIGNGYITDAGRTANLGTSKTIAAGAEMEKTYFSNGTFTVVVSNKYAITALIGGTGASGSCNYKNWSFDIEQLRGMSNLTNLQFHTSGFYGDIISLSSLTNLEWLELWSNPDLYGNISALANCINLQVLAFYYSSNVSGSIDTLINLTNLYIVDMSLCNVSGNISVFSNMNLTKFNSWGCPNIYGDIGECFKSSSTLFETRLASTQISGSVNSLANKTKLVRLVVNNT